MLTIGCHSSCSIDICYWDPNGDIAKYHNAPIVSLGYLKHDNGYNMLTDCYKNVASINNC